MANTIIGPTNTHNVLGTATGLPLASTLANLAASAAGPSFELQFSQLQNTIIRRVNKEIARVNSEVSTNSHRIDQLKKDGLKLADSLPLLQAYREGNSNNLGQLQQLYADTETLATSLGPDNTVDQSEVDAFNAQRDVVVARLKNLFVYVHPDIVDGKVIQYLKEEADTLNALSPVVGTKADNQAVTDAVSTFQSKLETALTVTQNTIAVTLQLEDNVQKKQTEILTQFEDLTTAEQARRADEIKNIKADYANVLTAISITFETNKNLPTELNKFLLPFRPEPGSILNLFT